MRVFSAGDGSLRSQFLAYGADFRGSVTVSTLPESRPAIITGAGPGGGPRVRQWRFPPNLFHVTFTGSTLDRDFFAFDPAFRGGVFVG